MIVRTLHEAEKTDRRVVSEGWEATRLLLKSDGMGFSFHITTIYAGAKLNMHYQHHLESVYCLSGEGEVTEFNGNIVHSVKPGTLYALNKNDKHTLHAFSELKMICVFNPPLHGKEVHNAEGAYELDAEAIIDE
jgi:L-ectoine synthase